MAMKKWYVRVDGTVWGERLHPGPRAKMEYIGADTTPRGDFADKESAETWARHEYETEDVEVWVDEGDEG